MKKLFSLFALTAFVVTPLLASNGLPIGADPCNADPIANGETKSGSTVGMPDQNVTGQPLCNFFSSNGGKYWFVHQAEITGTLTATTCGQASYDTALWGYAAVADCSDAQDCIAGSDDSCGLRTTISFDVQAGQEYFVMVGGFSNFEGNFSLTVTVESAADPCSDEDCPLEWSEALMDSNVECPSNLPTFCDEYYEYAGIEGLEAVNSCTGDTYEVATCFPLASQSLNLPVTTCMATTAQLNPEGNPGAVDGAVRLYNLYQTGLVDGEYFLEDPNNPLTLRYAPDSKTARLTGTVYCRENPNQIFHVDARFDNEQVASEWLAESPQHSLLSDDACSLDADAISVFDLAPMSRLEGDGELEGTLFIDHYPATYSARFQLGEGANNHNCNYGFGGWFRWSGTLNGEYTEGTTGDIVVDLACSAAEQACNEYAEFLFEAVDDCGRILSTTVTVTRDDTQNPVVVSGPQDMTVECDNVPPMAPGSAITATDNCEGPLTITDGLELRIDGNCPSNYTLDRRWTITDACGNSTVHTQVVTVQDTTDPVIVAEDMVEIACEDWPVDTAMATASDNCGNVELTFSQMDGDLGCIEPFTTYQRTYYAEDECDNSAVKAQTLVLVDNVDPEFTSVPESYTAECTDELVLDMATAMDNCGEPDVTVSTEIIPGECDAEYTMVRTFTADDGCGNAVTATQTIDVVDSTAPTLMTVPYFEGFRGQFAAENWETTEGISVTGNALTIVGYDNVANPYDDGVIQTAIAPCLTMGGTVSFDWDYSLNDLFPSFDVGFYVNGELMMELNETNSYEGSGSITFECNGGDIIGFGVDATDGCCGSATLVIDNFEVLGSEEPQALPGDLSFECDEVDQIPAAVTLYAMGNCSLAEVAFDESTVNGDCPQDYDIVRTWTASDECGNETIHTQTIQVRDTEAPEFTYVPADYTVQCAEDVVLEDATATDNCGEANIAYETEIVNQSCPNKYQLIRTISATDECGNSTTAQQTITVDDTMAPEFTFVPADYTVECSDDVTYENATAIDNCGEVTIEYSVDTVGLECPNNFQIIRMWVATDECDNSTTAQQTITVEDTMAPEFTFVPADYTVECSDDVTYEDATAIDNCGEVTIEYSVDTVGLECPNNFEIVRTWIATDECDNSTTVQQTITVDDSTAPEFTFVPADYTVECSDDVTFDDAEAVDNCGEVTISYALDTLGLSCPNNFQILRTIVATDDCNNSETVVQTITVEDTTAPEFVSVPADYSIECTDEPTYGDVEVMDNCSDWEVVLTTDTIESGCDNVYDIVLTWTATDACDNESSASQTISVIDTTLPQITFSCGLENGEIVDVCCEDLSGSITVPAACELEAVDFACGGDLTISLTETYEGEYTPSETVDHWCVISEPLGMDEGLTCEGLTPHAMRLFNFPGDDFYSLIDGAVSHNVDGTMTYYMTLVSQSNPDAGWELEAQFTQPLDWFEWQNQPGNHSFKNDCGLGDHMEWEYSIMTSGEAQGWGEYEGSDMTLMHQPVSGYFGFQMGEGANNKNGNYGFSGWFYCSGTFDGAPFNTSGDIFGELECCLPWTLDRAYTVADCSGNTTTFHYEVHATGAPCINEEEGGVQDGEDQTMVSYKDLIKVLDLMPNPTTGMTQVTLFTEELGTTAQVSLFNMAGQEVMPLFNGQLNAGWPMPLMFDASDLEAGMYQLRIHSKNFVTSKKLLVAH